MIIDAGAHIGLASVWFAERYPDAVIVAVEPEADNFEVLLANTAAYPNVRAVQAALWTSDGTVDLLDPGIGTWGFRVGDVANAGSHAVRAVTVRGLMAEFGLDQVDLLKLDVEGAEIELFSDCSGWIDSVDKRSSPSSTIGSGRAAPGRSTPPLRTSPSSAATGRTCS